MFTFFAVTDLRVRLTRYSQKPFEALWSALQAFQERAFFIQANLLFLMD
jgi:hypothetical protein